MKRFLESFPTWCTTSLLAVVMTWGIGLAGCGVGDDLPTFNLLRGLATQPGPAGDTGPAGADGVDGIDGMDGVDGTVGQPGPAGLQGAQGDAGEPGDLGPPGEPGADGTDGQSGSDGSHGGQGPAGPPGEPGPPGQLVPCEEGVDFRIHCVTIKHKKKEYDFACVLVCPEDEPDDE